MMKLIPTTLERLVSKETDEFLIDDSEIELCRNTNKNRSELSVVQRLDMMEPSLSSSDDDENNAAELIRLPQRPPGLENLDLISSTPPSVNGDRVLPSSKTSCSDFEQTLFADEQNSVKSGSVKFSPDRLEFGSRQSSSKRVNFKEGEAWIMPERCTSERYPREASASSPRVPLLVKKALGVSSSLGVSPRGPNLGVDSPRAAALGRSPRNRFHMGSSLKEPESPLRGRTQDACSPNKTVISPDVGLPPRKLGSVSNSVTGTSFLLKPFPPRAGSSNRRARGDEMMYSRHSKTMVIPSPTD
mmetsp:Transcript_3257/g.5716  ORF Transcript_3257/g.5716 Transcript_3257/m.5716 type:complete len:301 (-) Transcript_3257:23-925(-)